MRSPRPGRLAIWSACVASALCGPLLTAGTAGAEEPDRVIVARAPGLSGPERAALRAAVGGRLVRTLAMPGLEVLDVGRAGRAAALERLRRRDDVRFAEPDVRLQAFDDPDPFPLPYGIERIAAPAGWSLSTGAGVTVAVVDTGLAFDHPDLAGRIAVNPGELANGLDDDGNGLTDDLRGWDFVDGDNLPFDENGHGSLVAGVIAAHGGITGVAPDAQILPLRVLDGDGEGYLSDIAAAFDFAGASGVPIVNASLGARLASSPTMDAVFASHPGTLYVTAAGNDGTDNDVAPTFPCASQVPNVVCVGASDHTDARATFSNVGARTVDVFAPGVEVVSTIGAGYAQADGTSFAAPHVAGVAALLRAHAPGSGPPALKSALLAGADRIPALHGLAVTGARVNAARALTASPADADADGASDDWDVCPAVADPAQHDQDDDGIGDACQPVASPTPAAPSAPGPVEEDCTAPACRAPAVRSISARADRGRRRLVVRVRLDRPGTVYVIVARRRGCASVRCPWRTVAARRALARPWRTLRIAHDVHRRFPLGRYRITVRVEHATDESPAVLQSLRIR